MAHKTMVNGTVCEIDGGKTLINGVAYSIDKGKTLVNGTEYEVGFAEMVQIALTCGGPNAAAKINGEIINLYRLVYEPEIYEVPIGSEITFMNRAKAAGNVYVKHSDGTVENNNLRKNGMFSYTVIGNATISADTQNKDYGPGMYDPNTPHIYITET